MVAKKSFAYLKKTTIEVITFEVKPLGYLDDKTGVFETASHSVFSTSSYLMLHCESHQGERDVENILPLCKNFGIGLILFSDPKDYSTYNPILLPERKLPNYEKVEEFIKIQLSSTSKDRLLKW